MVGRFVEDKCIGIAQHHPGKHAAYLFAAGEYLGLFQCLFAGEKHFTEETPGKTLTFRWRGIFTKPVDQRLIGFEKEAVFLGKVGCRHGQSPAESTAVGFEFTGEDLEQSGNGQTIGADETYLFALVDHQGKVIQYLGTVDDLADTVNFQNDISARATGLEVDKGIFSL